MTKVGYRLFELKAPFYYTAAGHVCCLRQYNFVTGLQTHRLPRVRVSHHQLKHPDKEGKVPLPHPKKDLPSKTVASILKQAGLK